MTLEEFIIRMLIVAAIGFIIGIERQLTGHIAGLKPTVVIAIGTMAFVSVEIVIGNNDARMAANIITGIGFLCSGVILKNGLSVNGLSTSATLWATAAISVLVGYGYEIYGIAATGILLFFSVLERKIQIVADSGIASKISPKVWKDLANSLAEGFKSKNPTDTIVKAIEECGKILAKEFPTENENPNELPDGLVILGGGE